MYGRFETVKMSLLDKQLTNLIANFFNEMWVICNSTILNIFSNFIPHKYDAECDDKNLPWLNKKIRALIQEESAAAFKQLH